MERYVLIDMWSDIRGKQHANLLETSFPVRSAVKHIDDLKCRSAKIHPSEFNNKVDVAKFEYDYEDDKSAKQLHHSGLVVVAKFTDETTGVVLHPKRLEYRVVNSQEIWFQLLNQYENEEDYVFFGRADLVPHQEVLDTYEVVDDDGISYERWHHEKSGHEFLIDIEITRDWNSRENAS